MTKKIFRSTVAVGLAVLAASLVIIMSALYSYFGKLQEQQLKDELSIAAAAMAEGDGMSYLTRLDSDNYRITWLRADGVVLYDTRADAATMENHAQREEVRQALANGAGESSRYSNTMLIMVVALIIRRLPYTIRSSVAILQQIPMSIEEAAISLGASKMKAFFRITVPMMASGIISGAILSWVTMISELSTAIILYTGKTKTLTVAIYTEVIRGNYGTAAALSTIMTILTVISLLAFSKLNGGKDISL